TYGGGGKKNTRGGWGGGEGGANESAGGREETKNRRGARRGAAGVGGGRGANEAGESAPGLGARARREALRDLVLDHEDGAFEAACLLARGPKELAGDRVRQIPAQDARGRRVGLAEQRGKVRRLRVSLEDARARALELLREERHEIAVAFDGHDRRRALREEPGEGAGAGSDLDDARSPDLAVGDARAGDGAGDSVGDEEILAEALLRTEAGLAQDGARIARGHEAFSCLSGAGARRTPAEAVKAGLAEEALAPGAARARARTHGLVDHVGDGAASLAIGADARLEGRQVPAQRDVTGAEPRDRRGHRVGSGRGRGPDVHRARARLLDAEPLERFDQSGLGDVSLAAGARRRLDAEGRQVLAQGSL